MHYAPKLTLYINESSIIEKFHSWHTVSWFFFSILACVRTVFQLSLSYSFTRSTKSFSDHDVRVNVRHYWENVCQSLTTPFRLMAEDLLMTEGQWWSQIMNTLTHAQNTHTVFANGLVNIHSQYTQSIYTVNIHSGWWEDKVHTYIGCRFTLKAHEHEYRSVCIRLTCAIIQLTRTRCILALCICVVYFLYPADDTYLCWFFVSLVVLLIKGTCS